MKLATLLGLATIATGWTAVGVTAQVLISHACVPASTDPAQSCIGALQCLPGLNGLHVCTYAGAVAGDNCGPGIYTACRADQKLSCIFATPDARTGVCGLLNEGKTCSDTFACAPGLTCNAARVCERNPTNVPKGGACVFGSHRIDETCTPGLYCMLTQGPNTRAGVCYSFDGARGEACGDAVFTTCRTSERLSCVAGQCGLLLAGATCIPGQTDCEVGLECKAVVPAGYLPEYRCAAPALPSTTTTTTTTTTSTSTTSTTSTETRATTSASSTTTTMATASRTSSTNTMTMTTSATASSATAAATTTTTAGGSYAKSTRSSAAPCATSPANHRGKEQVEFSSGATVGLHALGAWGTMREVLLVAVAALAGGLL